MHTKMSRFNIEPYDWIRLTATDMEALKQLGDLTGKDVPPFLNEGILFLQEEMAFYFCIRDLQFEPDGIFQFKCHMKLLLPEEQGYRVYAEAAMRCDQTPKRPVHFLKMELKQPYRTFVQRRAAENYARNCFLVAMSGLLLLGAYIDHLKEEVVIQETTQTILHRRKTDSIVATADSKQLRSSVSFTRVRRIQLNPAAYMQLKSRSYTFRKEAWGVAGHWRHLKNGNKVYVRPYEKRRKEAGVRQRKEYTR